MTSSMSIMGSYSGITMDTIDQMIQAESGKLKQYTSQKTELNNEKTAWKDINTRLDTLYKKFEALKKVEAFDSKTVSNSNEKSVTVSAGTQALEGTYTVEVLELATSSQLTSGVIEKMNGKKATESLTLNGTLTLTDADNKAVSIEVKNGESLKDIVTKINESSKKEESGLRASIVDNRIVLMDSNMGERTITVGGSLAEDLGLAENETGTGAIFTEGSAAKLKINGIELSRNSNNITDAVEGVTFNLVAVSNNQVSTIKVAEDFEKTTTAVQEFVDQYNSTMSFIDKQLDVGDPSVEGNTIGSLTGDSSLMRLQSQLRSLMTSQSNDTSQSIRALSDIGIEVDRYGSATLNSEKLKKALTENSNDVQNFFFREESTVVTDAEGVKTNETKQFGLAQKMTSFINEYISEKTGIIITKSKTNDDMIKDLDKQITKFNERLEAKRERYIKQFTALDVAMMEAESQLSYLMSQIGTTQQTK
ncbi:flagellar filament capping protein FliD [Desemzia sp. RIT804]|uniref:flagellar filament capping protein FliD n=1 Tax=Desemzia sp. RIT 804 TaxID=2810209 RepID=UPI00194EC632|nr:flagellar filament capping protein FliD [Desemzia sp. RIT 804]MBM6614706.1 flagellar filament capping protein FliD [Desemzia sp. RIT 804]